MNTVNGSWIALFVPPFWQCGRPENGEEKYQECYCFVLRSNDALSFFGNSAFVPWTLMTSHFFFYTPLSTNKLTIALMIANKILE